MHAFFFILECYLPIIAKTSKQELLPKTYHYRSQLWRYLVQESIGLAPDSIKDDKKSYNHKPTQITSRHLHQHFKSVSSTFCLMLIYRKKIYLKTSLLNTPALSFGENNSKFYCLRSFQF